MKEGVARSAYDVADCITVHRINSEGGPLDEILQHLQSITPALSTHRVSKGGGGHEGRTACARLHLLGAVRGHAVLPAGTGAFLAGDLRGPRELRGQARASRDHRAVADDAGVREC